MKLLPAMYKRRPSMVRHHSSPVYNTKSPTRHQFRLANSLPREVKESSDARYFIDELSQHSMINDYQLLDRVSRGTHGVVRAAIDRRTGVKYAVKEFNKAALERELRFASLRRRRAGGGGGGGAGVTTSCGGRAAAAAETPAVGDGGSESVFDNGVRREIAIMKKLDHPNVVSLVEVLDDPHGTSLFMILEWCERPLMPPDYTYRNLPSPWNQEQCRLFFRDMILGIEYLHSQGVIHRDIKAENMLLSADNVLKIGDFGVSEIFEHDNDMIKRTAGSPAYMAPEVARLSSGVWMDRAHPHVQGRPADIWSMGVTLYYMLFGHLPFRSDTVYGLYDKIINADLELADNEGGVFVCEELRDLFRRILCKDPQQRIKMGELREHPWVTHNGEDMLLSREENTCDCITPITDADLISAIEKIDGIMDADLASEHLKRLHGWRGQLTPRADSPALENQHEQRLHTPQATASQPVSSNKLARALDEVLYGLCPLGSTVGSGNTQSDIGSPMLSQSTSDLLKI
ncbi:hypothetical protein TRVA0_018S01266 [Trichomonascus vanleenenianus]|uniref:serine/threonine-protein kinase n=1 Tax=Trichomonascus vanleenenianus TaxID=2268995 RepID=UPI003ECA6F67